MKQMPPNMKHIILANMNVKVYSWPLTFEKKCDNRCTVAEVNIK